jgi:hypothetical protein
MPPRLGREDAWRLVGAAIHAAFLALWAEVEKLTSRPPPYIRWDSVMVNGVSHQGFSPRRGR